MFLRKTLEGSAQLNSKIVANIYPKNANPLSVTASDEPPPNTRRTSDGPPTVSASKSITKHEGQIASTSPGHSDEQLTATKRASFGISSMSPDVADVTLSEFHLPRRYATPPKHSWDEPAINLANQYSVLSPSHELDIPFDNVDTTLITDRRRRNGEKRSAPNKRPTITTNEQYLQNEPLLTKFKRSVPGNKSYSTSVTNGKDILVITDSMFQRIRKDEFCDNVDGGNVKFKVFPGATTSKLEYYLVPELIEGNFKTVCIHVGTNDLFNKTEVEIVSELGDIRELCISYGVVKVIFSGIIRRMTRSAKMKDRRIMINSTLEGMCNGNWNVDPRIIAQYIDNDNIWENDIDPRGLHLEESGSSKLANNMLNCLNSGD